MDPRDAAMSGRKSLYTPNSTQALPGQDAAREPRWPGGLEPGSIY